MSDAQPSLETAAAADGTTSDGVSEYELKIDSQVEKFLETKHKLVYFLVTASVAPIIASVQFLYGKSVLVWITAAGGLGIAFGLLAAGSALRALWFEVASYRNHIRYRYERKKWKDLTTAQQEAWDLLNRAALRFTKAAFFFLYIEFISFAIVGIGLIVTPAHSEGSVDFRLLLP